VARSAFALVTSAAAKQLEIPVDDCTAIVESFEHDPHVFALGVEDA
jgi:hypothetical protein